MIALLAKVSSSLISSLFNETILILPSGLRTVNLTSDPLSAPLINLTASVTPYPVTSTASAPA